MDDHSSNFDNSEEFLDEDSDHLSQDNMEQLLISIRKHPELYDRTHKKFNDFRGNSKTWAKLGKPFGLDEVATKSRYRSARNSYLRSLRRGTKDHKYRHIFRTFGIFDDDEVSSHDQDIVAQMLLRIREHPELHDQRHAKFSERIETWKLIANEFGMDWKEAQRLYRNTRNCHLRALKNPKSKKYKYHDILVTIPNGGNEYHAATPSPIDPASIELIKAVECRPILYNGQLAQEDVREEIWQEIADNLDKTVSECKTKFLDLRRNWESLSATNRRMVFKTHMDFLLPYKKECETLEKVEETEDFLEDTNMETSGFTEGDDYTQDEEVTQDNLELNDTTTTASVAPDPAPGDLYFDEDQLKMFFSSIYSTVRSFQPRNVVKLKRKIFELVQDMQEEEMETK